MRVLVACEFSGIVRDAFTAKGHDAWSCDILPSERPGQHYQGDVLDILDQGWDLLIAHPPCTYLANSGVQYLKKHKGRKEKCRAAAVFFNKLLNAKVPAIAIENPIPHYYARELLSAHYSQLVRMNEFGENAYKPTCLWLKNLPKLKPTKTRAVETVRYPNGKVTSAWYAKRRKGKDRSVTFQGFADAMADQWNHSTNERSTTGEN